MMRRIVIILWVLFCLTSSAWGQCKLLPLSDERPPSEACDPVPETGLACNLPDGTIGTCPATSVETLDPPRKPKRRIADWHFWVVEGINVGMSLAATKTIHNCMQDHGLGRCVGGDYGSFPAKEAIRNGMTVGLIFPTYFLKKLDDNEHRKFKTWIWVPAANAAFNAIVIARNANRHYPPKEVE